MLKKIISNIKPHIINPSKHIGTEFEVDNWNISRFVINRLVPKVGYHPFPLNELALMASTVCFFEPTHIFEWGTHIGKSAHIFYETARYYHIPTQIHSIDLPDTMPHGEHPGNERGKMVKGLHNVTLHQGDGLLTSLDILSTMPDTRPLFFVDGDHSYQSVMRELSGILAATPRAAILLHDTFYQSPESNYNIGPFQAITDLLGSEKDHYTIINTTTGLPGMTLLYKHG